ncbi:MAG: hypothetical protein DRO11_05020 [Methanobacteriota archaeon]|nr:MAG: hypothetical protein DRO11_05020 [Euryarchaeota archaeon]
MLEGRNVLITGGSGFLGSSIAVALAENKAKTVAICYKSDKEKAMRTATKVRELGSEALTIRGDVSSHKGASSVAAELLENLGKLDILVNCVGDFLEKPLSQTSPEEWERVIRTNLHSVFYTCSAVLPSMRRNRWGRIVNLGVVSADHLVAARKTPAYRVAKVGVVALTKALAFEEAKHNITVNAILPGLIEGAEHTRAASRVPMGRLGSTRDVSDLVLFLVSEQAGYITGACIPVSGAWLI